MSVEALPQGSEPSRVTSGMAFSLATVAVVAAGLLVYASGSFLIAEIIGVKRVLQVALTVPLAFAAAYYWVQRPARLIDPLVGFVLVKTVVEIALRGEWIWVLDSVAALLALTVVICAPRASFDKGVALIVTLAGVFALMAFIQGVALFITPELGAYSLQLSDDGEIMNKVQHPIALLGFFGEQQYTMFGRGVARLQSFAREPSLNVVYFLLPASIAFLIRSRVSVFFGCAMLAFCVLSLSGSIYLSLGCVALWWVVLRLVPMKYALMYGLPVLMVLYLYVLRAFGLGPLFDAISLVARYGDFLNKGQSLQNRGDAADVNVDSALGAPFGSPVHPDLPGPWLINASLEAGWLGALLLLVFLWKLATQLESLNRHYGAFSMTRFGSLLLLGAMSTVMMFNDYQMSNYAGIVLLGFLYRQILLRNEEHEQ